METSLDLDLTKDPGFLTLPRLRGAASLDLLSSDEPLNPTILSGWREGGFQTTVGDNQFPVRVIIEQEILDSEGWSLDSVLVATRTTVGRVHGFLTGRLGRSIIKARVPPKIIIFRLPDDRPASGYFSVPEKVFVDPSPSGPDAWRWLLKVLAHEWTHYLLQSVPWSEDARYINYIAEGLCETVASDVCEEAAGNEDSLQCPWDETRLRYTGGKHLVDRLIPVAEGHLARFIHGYRKSAQWLEDLMAEVSQDVCRDLRRPLNSAIRLLLTFDSPWGTRHFGSWYDRGFPAPMIVSLSGSEMAGFKAKGLMHFEFRGLAHTPDFCPLPTVGEEPNFFPLVYAYRRYFRKYPIAAAPQR